MKFKMIDAAEVNIIRNAYKVLKRLQKRVNNLAEKCDAASEVCADCSSLFDEERRFLDELRALHINSQLNGDMSLEVK